MKTDADIREERGRVYGDPRVNHKGIAMQLAPMLQPWADKIANMEALPEHVVALMMVVLKINRMRNVYHEDNFVDARNYMGFAEEWQREHGGIEPLVKCRRRRMPVVYISHPYSSNPEQNTAESCRLWLGLWQLGKMIPVNPLWSHIQHGITPLSHDEWIMYDLSMFDAGMFDAVYRAEGESKGADMEVAKAKELGIPVFTSIAKLVEWCDAS